MTRSKASIVQELNQLMRARADHIRWWGGNPDFMKRTGRRLHELLAELEKEKEHEREDG